jgi:glycosyltransferase involved in cell wall biosynthesis
MKKSRKKVLYVVHGHPAFSAGGGEWATYFLYQAMKENGNYDPYLLARVSDPNYQIGHPGSRMLGWEKDDRTQLLVSNGDNYDYFYHSKMSANLHETDLYWAIKDYVLALEPDIVHFQHFIHLGVDLLSYVRSLVPAAKILLTLHEYEAICANQGKMLKTDRKQLCHQASLAACCRCFPQRKAHQFFLRERLFKSNFEEVDRFIAPSHFLKARYVDWGLDPERILVIDNGRPVWSRKERPPKRPGQPFRAAFFGQFVDCKGWDVFLKAAAEYLRLKSQAGGASQNLPEVRFSLHGTRDGLIGEWSDLFNRLVEAARTVVLDHGAYDMKVLQDLLSRVDCVVVPSVWWENSPLVIQEAFMAKVPVICSNIGGMAEKVTDRVNGLHFSVGDHFDLLDRILELASSPELYDRLVKAIPDVLSDREMVDQISSLYDELLGEHKNVSMLARMQQARVAGTMV